jgi:hypothetical protein
VHASFLNDDTEDFLHDDILHGLALEAIVQDNTNVPIVGDGMCKLENAATSLEWIPKDHLFSNVIELTDNGNRDTINKCCALSLMFKYSTSSSSTDCLRRVQQQACFVPFEHDIVPDHKSPKDCDILLVNNPVASLLSCKDGLFLCIREIIAMHMGSKSIDNLPLDTLYEDTIQVTFQVYSLVCTSPDDDNTCKNDWRTHEHLPMKFNVPGSLVQPINPCMATPPSRMPFYLFDTGTLLSLTSSLCDCLTKPYLKLVPNMECSHLFPYRERSGKCYLLF